MIARTDSAGMIPQLPRRVPQTVTSGSSRSRPLRRHRHRAGRPARNGVGSRRSRRRHRRRDYAHVIEITDLVDLVRLAAGTRMIARREPCTPERSSPSPTSTGTATRCASPTSPTPTSHTSKRSTAAADEPNDRSLTQRHRTHEPALAPLRDQPGLARTLPHRPRPARVDPPARPRTPRIPGDDLTRAEPKRLRYTLLHTAGAIITTGRRRYCRLATTGPGPASSSPRSNGSTDPTALLNAFQRSTGSRHTPPIPANQQPAHRCHRTPPTPTKSSIPARPTLQPITHRLPNSLG